MHNPANALPPVPIEMGVTPAIAPLPAYAPPPYAQTGQFMAMDVEDAPPSYSEATGTSTVAALPPMSGTAAAVSFYVRNKGSINGALFGGILGTCCGVIIGGSVGFGVGGTGMGFAGIPVSAIIIAPGSAVVCAFMNRNTTE